MVKKYTIGDALREGIALLNENKIESYLTDASVLLCHILSCDRLYLTIHKEEEMKDSDARDYFALIGRRTKREPVSYIVGKKEFMSLDFKVREGVLTPRPDTEILVETAIEALKGVPAPKITDMCTGSGAIAISLAKYIPKSLVTGLDVSEAALCVARENALANKVSVCFENHDITKPYVSLADAVVSNPPYIPTEDIKSLDDDVALYEPSLALDGGADGLDFYRAIVQNIECALRTGGFLAFEVGAGQAEDVTAIMEPKFRDITTSEDLAGIKRVVCGYLSH